MAVSRSKETRKKNRNNINPIHAAQTEVLHQEGKVRGNKPVKRFPPYSRLLIYH